MQKSTVSSRKNKPKKPAKPYPEFPLFPHASGRWCKKIKGRFVYFGPWNDPDAALQKYLDQKDDLHAGRTPRGTSDGLTISDLCNRFLNSKRHLLETSEITQRTFADYYHTCDRIVSEFGRNRLVDDLVADDFEQFRGSLAKTRGPVTLGNEIQRVRSVFKYSYENGLIDKPIRYGSSFKKPSKKAIRKARNGNGKRMFEAEELRLILDALDGKEVRTTRIDDETGEPEKVKLDRNLVLKSMVLLSLNAAFGQTDVSCLPISAIDFDDNWITFPRPKSGVSRRCPLWAETSESLKEAITKRPQPNDKADDNLVFLTKYGNPWVRISQGEKKAWVDSVGLQFGKLLKSVGLKRDGLNFYALRHTFRTVADRCKDGPAIDHVMGHSRDDMASLYREEIEDQRLEVVAETVRSWLWPEPTEPVDSE